MSQSFADLGLTAELSRACADAGYNQPTPVQIQAIPLILEGRDVLAGAQTGTGKTAGFTLPLLQRLATTEAPTLTPQVRALIVTPTRELAMQVEDCVRDYGKYLPLRSTVIFGGVGMGPQIEALQEGVEIVVATPGRLLDHCNEQTIDLSNVEILVLDEADRMLDMGFIHDVQRILALLPQQRQNLLFSATFSDEVRALATSLLHDPAQIEAAARPNAESELIAQRVHPTGQERKRTLLTHLIKSGAWKQVLVFTRTKHGANRLAHQLGRSGISASAIHGNKGQGARVKALDDFKAGQVRVLVATDLAARGLDIVELPHVVNYDLPQVAEDYVHRIGRTGRAGAAGEAISLVAPEEQPLLAEIEKLIGRTLEQTLIAGYEPGSVSPHQLQQQQRQQARVQQQPPQGDSESDDAREESREGGGRRRRRGRNRNSGEHRENNPGEARANAVPLNGQPHAAAGAQPRQPRERNFNRAEQNQNRRRQREEDRDNRGNRDTTPRNQRNVILDDDFGNRIPPVKVARGIRARILAGDIDEELDNIGNRLPPPPKHQRNPDAEDEINYNVALPQSDNEEHEYDARQPSTNAGQMFPSSAGFMAEPRRKRGNARLHANGKGKGKAKGSNGNIAHGVGNGNGSGNGAGNDRKRNRRRSGQGGGQPGQQPGQPQRQAQPRQKRQGQTQQRHRSRGGRNRQQGERGAQQP